MAGLLDLSSGNGTHFSRLKHDQVSEQMKLKGPRRLAGLIVQHGNRLSVDIRCTDKS